jgi:hypothetical protein
VQNFTGTNGPESGDIRTKPVQGAAVCAGSVLSFQYDHGDQPTPQKEAASLEYRGGLKASHGKKPNVNSNDTNGSITKPRIARAITQIEYCLRELRRTDHPGRLSAGLALVLLNLLGPNERAFLLDVMAQAADPDDLEDILFRLGVPPLGDV